MREDNITFELRSEEVQDILTRVPHWMIRWGTALIFGIVLMMFFVAWFLKYPDVLTAEIVITTRIPPEKIVSRTSGRIEAVLVKDKAAVSENTILAVVENNANYKDVFILKKCVDNFNLNNTKEFPFYLLKNAQLGDIENAYAIFQKACTAQELNSQLQPFEIESKAQISESIQIKERLNLLQQQRIINEKEIQLQKNDLNRFEVLYNKGIISTQDFENRKLGFLQADKNYRNLLSSISQLRSSLINNTKLNQNSLINGTTEAVNLDRTVTQTFYQLRKAIKDWELTYTLRTSVSGVVTFLQVWTNNQSIAIGENVFTIIPTEKNSYLGKLKAPALNSGKIKVGQRVQIKLFNFPDKEFGVLRGRISNISLVPDPDGNLLIDVSLPKGLESSYKRKIPFQQEMKGTAGIVTEDLRFLERIMYQFKDIFGSI
jgi:multidrug resistance efflux pump